ncbi:MAG: hypothetical protein KGN79_09735 [Acidobacteriota bacterium]|nr:hypothetical protein [Acidobacteriota bacterium]
MDASGIERKPSKLKEAFGSTSLKIEDLDDELQCTVTRQCGWFGPIAIACIASGLSTYAILTAHYFYLLMALLLLASLFLSWARGPVTTLRISGNRILATGNLERLSSSDFRIEANKVDHIGWSSGGENGSQGLYVWHGTLGWGSNCVLPGLSKRHCVQVTDAIAAKFPHYKIANSWNSAFTVNIGN